MSNAVLDLPEKEAFLLVEFRYGDPLDPSFSRYTDRTEDYVLVDKTFESTPAIEVATGRRSGSIRGGRGYVELPSDSFTDFHTEAEPRSIVFVRILEVVPEAGGGDLAVLTLFVGRAFQAISNPGGRGGRVRFDTLTWKALVEDSPAGISANHLCPWRLGGPGCQLPGGLQQHKITVTIDAIDGTTVTIDGATITTENAEHWRRGYLEKDGIQVTIQDCSDTTASTDADLQMVEQVPSYWLDATDVVLVPGCDKSRQVCNSEWGNLDHFGGVGLKMPKGNPLIETGVT